MSVLRFQSILFSTLFYALLLTLGSFAQSAHAQRLTNNSYTIDVYTGPVLGSGRITGMGGANTALATGIDGVRWNPASYSSRVAWELDWFEWDITASLLLPYGLGGSDFDNDGKSGFTYDDFYFVDFGARFQLGELGFGAVAGVQSYNIADGNEPFNVALWTGHAGASYDFVDGQLSLGGGVRFASLNISQVSPSRDLVQFSGAGLELGAALKIAKQPWRLGFAFSDSVHSKALKESGVMIDSMGIRRVGNFALPSQVIMPWEMQIGFAYQFGARELNSPWVNPHDEKEKLYRALASKQHLRIEQQTIAETENAKQHGKPYGKWMSNVPQHLAWWQAEYQRRAEEYKQLKADLRKLREQREQNLRMQSRSYVLTSLDLVLIGPVDSGVGLESFLSQVEQRSGRDLSWGIRVGVETEPWKHHLKVRAGHYIEPSRFDPERFRLHGTVGFDIKVLTWDVFGIIDETDWRITASTDLAPRYFQWGLGIGVWH